MFLRNSNERLSASCKTCGLRLNCLSAGLTEPEMDDLISIISTTKKVHKGDKLFYKSSSFKNLYVIRTGSFKSTLTTADGTEQVTEFYFPGEMLGLGGIASGEHFCDLSAMEDSEVCVVPFNDFEKLCHRSFTLNKNLLRYLSAEYVRGNKNMFSLGSFRSEEKIAYFLLDMSHRFESRGYSRTEFILRMTRSDIGSFLGMKPETVSRVLSKFSDANLIEIRQKRVHLIDLKGLRNIFSARRSALSSL